MDGGSSQMTADKPRGGKSGDPSEPGLDRVDAASAASMDASDPPAFGGVTGVGAVSPGDGRHDRIERRAHELWAKAGSPKGHALEFWLQAEAEVDDEALAGAETDVAA